MTDQTACRPGTIATIALPANMAVVSAIVAGIVRTRPGVRAVQHGDHMDVCAPETEQRTTLTIPGDPKMIREALWVADHATRWNIDEEDWHGAREVLSALIQECDRHRPLGPDGKHGNRHTATCGCDDVPERYRVAEAAQDGQERAGGVSGTPGRVEVAARLLGRSTRAEDR